MSDGKRYTDERWLREKYEGRGLTSCEIADMCGVDDSTICRWLDRHGIEIRGRSYDLDPRIKDPGWMRDQYESGVFTTELADELDAGIGTVIRWMNAHGIDRLPSRVQQSGEEPGHNWRRGARWKRVRRAVLERDGGRCQSCSVLGAELDEPLHVHHITPVSEGGPKYELDNLVTLCPDCHLGVHH